MFTKRLAGLLVAGAMCVPLAGLVDASPSTDTVVTFPVATLTKDNQARAVKSVEAICAHDYVCPSCKSDASKAGMCGKCNVERKVAVQPGSKAPTFAAVVEVGEKLNTKMHLRDVIWSTAKAAPVAVSTGKN